ncbi:outer membrane protein assembly factor BamD [Nisaea acidiphila]|uniref:Outer membrane protein assembly factor BamD n=1 Tax=Nisaea acidiphila TaxID=1862145 RepID=A0A9J7AN65_9PROT|nr:outer membrane protein assembly factor BamD [Nisaea acidiphila]UUX49083.1 outer membrane protein assembly factor BamD [Nisaea acidiphila]
MKFAFGGLGPLRAKSLALVAGALALTACSSDEPKLEYVERPVEELYNEAVDTALEGDYKKAAPLFDEVERQHPYSVWATQAQLMAAYSQYQSNKYDEAIGALDRFIQLNPSNANVDYAYYLKGLCYYEQIVDVGRDQKLTRNAMETLQELVQRFPGSKYSRDALLKIDLTRNHLAGKEMEIGRFYLRQGQYLAAINRFKRVVENYDTTDQVPEALHRLTEAYAALGLHEQAERTAAVLGHNYPGSEWYQDSYALMTTGANRGTGSGEGLLGLGLWVF